MERTRKILQKIPHIFLVLIFILGIYLRTKVYLTNQSFWHDECALAWNVLNRSYLELFEPLRFLQVAPPLFLIYSKIIIKYFGTSELVYRLVPFVASLLSMVLFFFLSRLLFYTKRATLCAMALFAVSFPLYYYCAEFKPYSTDVLFCIFTMYIYLNLNKENIFWYSLILSTFIWFSFPTAFLLGAIALIVMFSKKYSGEDKAKMLFHFSVSSLVFYFYYFRNVYDVQHGSMLNYWQNEFISVENFSVIMQKANEFIFSPEIVLPILMALGLIMYFYQKSKFAMFSVLSILLVILISMLHLYPFSGRMILFLIPIFILLCSKIVDFKGYVGYLILGVFLYGAYPQFENTYNNIKKNNFYKNNSTPREIAEYLSKNIKSKDVVYVNVDSNCDYLYYKEIFSITNQEIIDSPELIRKGTRVWFFLPNNAKVTYKKVVKNKYKILYGKNAGNSGIIYAIKIK